MARIGIDAFGGDNAPLEILKGALEAKNEFNIDIIFTGSEEIIKKVSKEKKQKEPKVKRQSTPSGGSGLSVRRQRR